MAGPWRVRFIEQDRSQLDYSLLSIPLKTIERIGFVPWSFWRTHRHQDGGPQGLFTLCPCCGRLGSIAFQGAGLPDRAEWTWNGDADLPTLSPSVYSTTAQGGCGMHVWVRDGQIMDAGTPPHGPDH